MNSASSSSAPRPGAAGAGSREGPTARRGRPPCTAAPSRRRPTAAFWRVFRVRSRRSARSAEDAVDPLDLGGGQRRRPRRVAADGVEMFEEAASARAACRRQPARGGGPAGRRRPAPPPGRSPSPASRRRSRRGRRRPSRSRVLPRPRLLIGFAAALDGGGQRLAALLDDLAALLGGFGGPLAPLARLSPRYSRVSRPVAGAYSSATAAPLTAPRMNASRMLPAPAPSSLAIVASGMSNVPAGAPCAVARI